MVQRGRDVAANTASGGGLPRPTVAAGIAALGALVAAFLFVAPVGPMNLETSRVAALTVLVIVLWATNIMPPFLAALIYFGLATLFDVVPPSVVFSGFASGAFWLVFGGLVIGVAVKQTGLATRIANAVAGRFGSTYTGLIGGVVLLGVLLSFIMPSSMGRVVLLVPIAAALADRCGFDPTARGRYGLLLATVYGAHLPSFGILPANVPNMVLAGTAEAVWGTTFIYGDYFLLHFPVIGLLKALLVFGAVAVMFRDELPVDGMDYPSGEPMSADEWRLSVIMTLVLGMWATDFLHGVAPSWVALVAGVVLLTPGIGILETKAFNRDISFSALFFVAGGIALGGMIAGSDLSTLLADGIERLLPLELGADALNFALLSGTAAVIALVGTIPTAPAVMVPLADVLAALSGWSLDAVLLVQVVGFSTIFLPYQAPPLLVGVLLGEVPLGEAIRLNLVVGLVTVVVLLPLAFVWWSVLGRI
jgi:anion transporter